MKKIISMLLAVMIMGSISISALAASEGDSGKLDNRIETLEDRQLRLAEIAEQNEEKQANFSTKKEEYQAFRASLTENRQTILDNADANLEIASEIDQLRLDLLKTIDAIQESGTQLPEDISVQLADYNDQLHDLVNLLKDTQGQIKDVKEEYRGYVKDMDYAAMDTAFEGIASVQEYRYDLMNQIKGLLQEMNTLLDNLS
jgi:chromosome segregation ATPase